MAYDKEYNRLHCKKYREKHKEEVRLKQKEYYEKNKERLLQKKKEYYNNPIVKSNREEYKGKYYSERKELLRAQMQEYYKVNRNIWLYNRSKRRAREDGIEFTIELSDIIIPTYCPLLGIELTNELGHGQLQSNSSIDRIDSSKGYIKGNVQVISRLANTMKSSATSEQLITFAKNVLKIYER